MVWCADVGAGRDDLVDLVEDLVAEGEVDAGQLANKRGLASALHSGDPAFEGLPDYFFERLGPVLEPLLQAATASGEIRTDIGARDLLRAIAHLCQPADDEGVAYSQRMVALLINGLRHEST